jgi:mono/diheme cytochrome c family protein
MQSNYFSCTRSHLLQCGILIFATFCGFLKAQDYADKGYLTFDLKPMGSTEKPLILRTFCPDPGLDPDLVLGNHSRGTSVPKYSARSGQEMGERKDHPIAGVPAGIAVNLGKSLSYVWDTTECRLLYAWTDGFLDMKNYWGDEASGRRKGFDYVPQLHGFLFYQAVGQHPLQIDGKSISVLGPPFYLGYELDSSRQPVFSFSAGPHSFQVSVRTGPGKQTLELTYTSKNKEALTFSSPKTQVRVKTREPGKIVLVVRPNAGKRYKTDQKAIALTEATLAKGEELYNSMGCVACHTTDGGLNHGPTFKGLYEAEREFITAQAQKADEAYLIESIQNPSAKTVKGYLQGMMPPYQLQPLEYDSLVLFIKSLP